MLYLCKMSSCLQVRRFPSLGGVPEGWGGLFWYESTYKFTFYNIALTAVIKYCSSQ